MLGQHAGPHVCEIGKRFRGGGDVLDLDAVDAQTKHCGERRHAMVRVGFHFGGLEIRCRHWHDLQPVGKLTGFSPDSGDFVDQCFQTVRLVAAQVADAQHARRLVGEDQDCGQRWRNLAGRSGRNHPSR